MKAYLRDVAEPVPAKVDLTWWQERGLQQTASGYGRKLLTQYKVHYKGRWRRVYCCCISNSGTCYLALPKGDWLIVEDVTP
jgi:hypothetical protein